MYTLVYIHVYLCVLYVICSSKYFNLFVNEQCSKLTCIHIRIILIVLIFFTIINVNMAYISYNKLWESEFDGIVSERDNF